MRHVPPDRVLSDCTFFLTINFLNHSPRFASESAAKTVLYALQFYRSRGDIELYGWVIMPDHIHLLLRVTAPDTASTWTRRFKSYISHAFGKGPLWQHGYWSESVVTGRFFLQKLKYIHDNPVRAGLSETAEGFPWSSAIEYFRNEFVSITPHWEIGYPLVGSSSTEAAA